MLHVLFISHDANRTGAPIVLLHLLRWLKKQQTLSFSILLLQRGELEEEFRAVAPTYIWQKPATAGPLGITQRVWNRIKRLNRPHVSTRHVHEQHIISSLLRKTPNLIYANTVVSAEVGMQLKTALRCPVVCHVHELAMAIEGYFGTARFGNLLPEIDLVIAASEAVRSNLLATYAVASSKIVKVYEFIAAPEEEVSSVTEMDIRASLGIPADAFLVAASGTYEWRKSPSLFIQLADYTRQHLEIMPYFVWIGGRVESEAGRELQFDVDKLGLTQHVKFIGSRPNPLDYLRSADLFVLTSREDPYPLVCLEAATLAKPVLCFAQSGGMPEFVEDDSGCVVPYLQIELMARAIQELLLEPTKRNTLGRNAQTKVRSRHSVDVAGQQITNLIYELSRKN
jgi:glycosyltransferase involved in cell wall biosynthesis